MKLAAMLLVTLCLLLFVGALSRYRYDLNPARTALLRLSWRTRAQPEQHCRPRTEAELEALPAHMRTPEVCTGRIANYRLELRVDGREQTPMLLHAAGAHADRPIYVFRETALTEGSHEVEVHFLNTAHPDRPGLRLARHVHVRTGEILLITYDAEADALVLRRERSEQ